MPFFAPERFAFDDYLIRCYTLVDGAAIAKATAQSYRHLAKWMPWASPEEDIEGANANCRRFLANYLRNEDFTLGIWRGEELVGGTGFHLRWGPLDGRVAEIGMWIAAAEAGKGLGTRALRAMLEWGFTEWGWRRLVWQCDVQNAASARAAQKAGMILEGTHRQDAENMTGGYRDTHVFAILRQDWTALTTAPADLQGGQ